MPLRQALVDDDVTDEEMELALALVQSFDPPGVGARDVVTYILPNLPQTHFTLWGAETAGIANPLTPARELTEFASSTTPSETPLVPRCC